MMFAVSDVFVSYSCALHISLMHVQDFSLMITTDHSTALKLNSMTEDNFICTSFFRSKSFCILSQGTKKVFIYLHNFSVSFFYIQEHTNRSTLMDTKQ